MTLDPASLAGKKLWLRAKDLGSGTVTSWSDQSGTSHDPTSITSNVGTSRGLLTVAAASTPAGGKSARFDYVGVTLPSLGLTTAGEMWVVVKSDGGADAAAQAWKFGTQTGGSVFNYFPYSGTIYDDFGSSGRYSFLPGKDLTTWTLYRVGVDAAGTWFAQVDNVLTAFVYGTTPAWNATPSLSTRNPSGDLGGFKGNIAEVLIRDRASTGPEVAALIDYFNTEHGLSVAGSTLTDYNKLVLADAPVGYWPFEEASGSSIRDISGHGYVAAASGAYTRAVSGKDGNATTFAGGKAVTSVTLPNVIRSAEAWVYPTSTKGQMIAERYGSGNNAKWQMYLGTDNALHLWMQNESLTGSDRSGGTVPLNQWSHVAFTADSSGTVTLYVNGNAVSVTTPGEIIGNSASTTRASVYPLTIGSTEAGASTFDGRIDELAVYSTVLPASRIVYRYLMGAITGYKAEVLNDNPLGYWRLGESSGTTAADSSGNSRALAAASAPTWSATSLLASDTANKAATIASGSQAPYRAPESWMWVSGRDYTVEAWIKTSNTGVILSMYNVAAGNGSVACNFIFAVNDATVYGGTTGRLMLWVNKASGVITTQSSASVNDGNIHHVAAVVDNTAKTITLYIDGTADGVTSFAGQTLTGGINTTGTTNPLIIGCAINSGTVNFTPFNGVLDEVALYGTKLTSTRIAAHYTAGTALGTVSITDTTATATANAYPESAPIPQLITDTTATATANALPETAVVAALLIMDTTATGAATAFVEDIAFGARAPLAITDTRATANANALVEVVSYAPIGLTDVTATATADARVETLLIPPAGALILMDVTAQAATIASPEVVSFGSTVYFTVPEGGGVGVLAEFSGLIDSTLPAPSPPIDRSKLPNPTSAPTLTLSSGGSILAPGTYRYKYAAWRGSKAQATAPSPAATITVGVGQKVSISFATTPGADGYLIYREDV